MLSFGVPVACMLCVWQASGCARFIPISLQVHVASARGFIRGVSFLPFWLGLGCGVCDLQLDVILWILL